MATPPTTSDMGRSRGPVSPESRTNSTDDQGKDKINRLPGGTPPETFATRKSTRHFPYDIMEMIIAYLTRDLDVLKACSLTCRSWYIAAVPHLHHTLTLRSGECGENRRGLEPLSLLHGFGLAPLVKEIRVRGELPGWGAWFVPRAFSPHDLHHFSAFANVHTLKLESSEIHRFIPGVERYFGHLSSTLRSIRLLSPCCAPRQISHFLSLFSNLDDVSIGFPRRPLGTAIPDIDLVPFSAPRLQGRLELYEFNWVEPWTDLITSCGGLRFRCMDLYRVKGCAPVLLRVCAGTLEMLRCSLLDIHSSLRPKIDISQLKVLRSLQIRDWAAKVYTEGRHTVAMEVFSAIASPVFSELVIVLRVHEILDLPSDITFFETLRTMKGIRPFKLVFLLNIPSPPYDQRGRWRLVETLDRVRSKGLLDFLDSPPIVR